MNLKPFPARCAAAALVALIAAVAHAGEESAEAAPAYGTPVITGAGPGWRVMTEDDFVNVNCDEDTWDWRDDGLIACTGTPIGVIRTHEKIENFELVVEWRHLKPAGNSGVFVWVTEQSVDGLERNKLPHGIEVQILDHGYTEYYEQETGNEGDWFTTNGDVFPVGVSEMTPFPPVSPNGERSFPSKNVTKGAGEWNHYYVRAVNGEVRLWVNGEEVSGGTDCAPSTGYLALESEGSPIEFKNLRIRELP